MTLLAITADTWIVTGLGFGVVLLLLFFLVFVMMFFGWTMQKIEAPRAPKAEAPKAELKAESPKPTAQSQQPTAEDKVALAMSLSAADGNDEAAVAYALYLAHHSKHDIPTAMISLHKHETAWNEKSIGMNNVGF